MIETWLKFFVNKRGKRLLEKIFNNYIVQLLQKKLQLSIISLNYISCYTRAFNAHLTQKCHIVAYTYLYSLRNNDHDRLISWNAWILIPSLLSLYNKANSTKQTN